MKKALLVFTIVLGCSVVFVFGGPSLFAGTPQNDLIFNHQDPDFSITFPSGYNRGVAEGDVVARFERANQDRIPNYSIRVYDSMHVHGKTGGQEILKLADEYSEVLKTVFPEISDVQILEKRIITLNDGSSGVAWKMKWKWTDKVTYLQSAAVASPRGNKIVSCFGTDLFREDNSIDLMLDQCTKLTFTP